MYLQEGLANKLNISVGVTDVVLFNYSLSTAEIIRADVFI
jgi:hypothetical protein